MHRYYLRSAYLQQGWVQGVRVGVSDQGLIAEVDTSAAQSADTLPGVERVEGFVVPGMPNGHSHSFQRAMAG